MTELSTEKKMDVVTFGETMALFMPQGAKGIEFSQGMEQSFGGAESNAAIGLARLGCRVGWFGRLGHDPFGRMIVKRLRGEGVDVSRAVLTDEAPTGLMMRETVAGQMSVYYYRKNSAASRMAPEHLDAEYIAGARVLHVSGITPALSDSCRETVREAIRIAKRNGVRVCFDPNLRLKLWGIAEARETLLAIAREADYFLPGLEELQLLFQTDDREQLLANVRELPAVTVIKGGDGETLLVEPDAVTSVRYPFAANVVDPVGAGDGFCAGFLAGVLKGMPLAEAVRLGNWVGTTVVQTAGDWEGLPTWEQAEAWLGNRKHIER